MALFTPKLFSFVIRHLVVSLYVKYLLADAARKPLFSVILWRCIYLSIYQCLSAKFPARLDRKRLGQFWWNLEGKTTPSCSSALWKLLPRPSLPSNRRIISKIGTTHQTLWLLHLNLGQTVGVRNIFPVRCAGVTNISPPL